MSTLSPAVPEVPRLTELNVLARGGDATVYRANILPINHQVAVKVYNRTLEGDEDRRRFIQEVRAVARLSAHPHVVDIFDVGVTQDGQPYLIMEVCDGSYRDRMTAALLSAAEASDVGAKIADALEEAHAVGVLHGGVKPANILVTRLGEPALADFGLAVLGQPRNASMKAEVNLSYTAPEVFFQGRLVAASDVYCLCATLYAFMRGRPPQWRDIYAPTLPSLLGMVTERAPDLAGVPAELTALLRRGIANDPAARPSAAQLRDELLRIRDS